MAPYLSSLGYDPGGVAAPVAGARPRLAQCVVRQAVGEKVLPEFSAVLDHERRAGCSAIWFVAAPAAGVLADVSGLDEARRTEGVTEVKLLVRPGSTIGASDSRVAYVRAVGESADAAVNTARKAAAHLEFHFVAPQRTVALVSEKDCADVVESQDLILRNLKVTEAYYRLSIGMTLLTGHQDVSWLTFRGGLTGGIGNPSLSVVESGLPTITEAVLEDDDCLHDFVLPEAARISG